jgi:hypothetical protein
VIDAGALEEERGREALEKADSSGNVEDPHSPWQAIQDELTPYGSCLFLTYQQDASTQLPARSCNLMHAVYSMVTPVHSNLLHGN